MLSEERAHAVSTGHAVVVHVKRNEPNQFYGSWWADWMCLACPARGGFGGSG